MTTIYMVQVINEIGESWFYAGANDKAEAFYMAAQRGYEGDKVTAKMIPNKFGISEGEWRSAAP